MPQLIRKRSRKVASKRTGKQVEKVSWFCQVPVGKNEDGSVKFMFKTFAKEADAKAWVASLIHDVKTGAVVKPSEMRLAEYLDQWLKEAAAKSVRSNTLESYRVVVEVYLKPQLGHVPLAKLNAGLIQAAYNRLGEGDAEKGRGAIGARSVRYAHSILHNAMDQAVTWHYLRRNPTVGVTLPKHVKEELDVLTAGEAADLVAEGHRHRLGALLELALATGMRPGEMLGLQWSEVDLEAGLVRVVRKLTHAGGSWTLDPPKTKRGRRTIPIPPETVATLERWRKAQARERLKAGELWKGPHNPVNGFVFTQLDGQPLEQRNVVNRLFKPTLRRLVALQTKAREMDAAGATLDAIAEALDRPADAVKRWVASDRVVPEDLRLYDLRHTHATMLLSAGVNPKVASERLGHASVSLTLDTYSHVLPTMQEAAAEKVGALLYGSGR